MNRCPKITILSSSSRSRLNININNSKLPKIYQVCDEVMNNKQYFNQDIIYSVRIHSGLEILIHYCPVIDI